ncbi:MAG: sulfatase [Planctomycetota bacterium]
MTNLRLAASSTLGMFAAAVVWLSIGWGCSSPRPNGEGPAAEGRMPPNIVLLLTDDQRADALGCAGHPVLRTPHLDAMARRGQRFAHAFVSTSICAASRASILTSLHEGVHGYTFGTSPLADQFTTESYPALLRAAGYRTGLVGKVGVKMPAGALARLFDHCEPMTPPYRADGPDGDARHLTDRVGDAAIRFLRAEDSRPFCLSVSFNAPHAEDSNPKQYIWPPTEDGLYREPPIASAGPEEAALFEAQPSFLRESLNRERWAWRFDTPAKAQSMIAGYYRMISGVDRVVGRIVDALADRGVADETVIIFSSDNGYFLGERGFAGKWLIHEPSIRVPLVVVAPHLPDVRGGVVQQAVALNLDLAPTILDFAGVAIPEHYQGRSLLPLLRGAAPDWRDDFYYEHRFAHARIPKSEGVRDARWTYARYFEQDPVFEELYDRDADPAQRHNLAGAPESAPVLTRLRARCDELGRIAHRRN